KLRDDRARREPCELARLAGEMRLVGIAGFEGDAGQPGRLDAASELDEALEAQDAVERLRAEAEEFVAAAAQRALGHPGLADQPVDQLAVERRVALDQTEHRAGPAISVLHAGRAAGHRRLQPRRDVRRRAPLAHPIADLACLGSPEMLEPGSLADQF